MNRPLPLHRLFAMLTLPVLAAWPAAAQKAPAPKPVSADNAIIPLPLNPVLPPAKRVCAARTPTGLGYTVLRAGEGAKPAADDTVLVNYIGYLNATGAVFDQSMQSPMPLNGVIPAFSQGVQMIGRGGIIRLCVPAALGYGAEASGPIPANSDLVFQIELLDFKTAAEIDAMRKAAGVQAPKPSQP